MSAFDLSRKPVPLRIGFEQIGGSTDLLNFTLWECLTNGFNCSFLHLIQQKRKGAPSNRSWEVGWSGAIGDIGNWVIDSSVISLVELWMSFIAVDFFCPHSRLRLSTSSSLFICIVHSYLFCHIGSINIDRESGCILGGLLHLRTLRSRHRLVRNRRSGGRRAEGEEKEKKTIRLERDRKRVNNQRRDRMVCGRMDGWVWICRRMKRRREWENEIAALEGRLYIISK